MATQPLAIPVLGSVAGHLLVSLVSLSITATQATQHHTALACTVLDALHITATFCTALHCKYGIVSTALLAGYGSTAL